MILLTSKAAPGLALALAITACLPSPATATDLASAWNATRIHAPALEAARAAKFAGATQVDQAEALGRPSVFAQATVGLMGAGSSTQGAQFAAPGFGQSTGVSFNTSIRHDVGSQWLIGVRQSIVDRERDAQRAQLRLGAEGGELQSFATQQQLMLDLAHRYFELAMADRQLALLERQAAAVDRAWTEARDRFQLGDAPVTDTHEAAARARALQAQSLAARNRLADARSALAELSGLREQSLRALVPGAEVLPARLDSLEVWLERSEASNPVIRLARLSATLAAQDVARQGSASGPKVEWVAQASREQLNGSGAYGEAGQSQNRQLLGITVAVPLSTGGLIEARLAQAQLLLKKAQAEVDVARQQTVRQIRSVWLSLQAAPAQLEALDAAVSASRSRLDATRLGRQVGDRTTQDLLNAENDASAAELALLQARVAVLIGRLQLEALAGQLDEDALKRIDRSLQG